MAKAKDEDYKRLKASLLENLEARGLVEDVYIDKVNEYMDLWRRRRQLEEDIEKRGITVMDERRGMLIENRSVSLEVQISRMMLSIFNALGFKGTAEIAAALVEDDEL